MNPLLIQYLKLKHLLLIDEGTSYQSKIQRDRELALKMGIAKATSAKDKKKQLLAWYQNNRVWLGETNEKSIINTVNIFAKLKLVSLLFGSLFGLSVATALFFYTGDAPINVVNFLWIVVFLQSFFVAFVLLSILPDGIQDKIPGLNILNNGLRKIAVGQWIYDFSQWLLVQKSNDNSVHQSQKSTSIDTSLVWNDRKLIKWQVIICSQWFALSFNVILLLTALYLVLFSDLAFGWSSTVDIQVGFLKSITDAISLPWHTFMPMAVPSEELIESTRYFRALSGQYSSTELVDVKQLGQWWPFLVGCIVVYGIAPRLLILIISYWGFRYHLHWGVFDLDGVSLLLQRMNSEWVTTRSETKPEKGNSIIAPKKTSCHLLVKLNQQTKVLHWFDKVLLDADYWKLLNLNNNNLQFEIDEVGMDFAINKRIEDEIKNKKTQTVLILVKSWEPPMMSFIDWINSLNGLTKYLKIQLLPYGIAQDEGKMILSIPSEVDLAVWSNKVANHVETPLELMMMNNHDK